MEIHSDPSANLFPLNHLRTGQTSPGETSPAEPVEGNQRGSTRGIENESESSPESPGAKPDTELTAEEKRIVDQLRARDREVRAHEQAHKAAAGALAKGAPTFEYQTGPDGKRYAVGGEVQIDTSKVSGDPQATIRKAQTIRRAANAPRNPSTQDRQVAAQASRLETEARQELQKQRAEETKETGGIDKSNAAPTSSQQPEEQEKESSPPLSSTPSSTGNFLDILL